MYFDRILLKNRQFNSFKIKNDFFDQDLTKQMAESIDRENTLCSLGVFLNFKIYRFFDQKTTILAGKRCFFDQNLTFFDQKTSNFDQKSIIYQLKSLFFDQKIVKF